MAPIGMLECWHCSKCLNRVASNRWVAPIGIPVGGTDWNRERTILQQMPESGSVQSVGGTYWNAGMRLVGGTY